MHRRPLLPLTAIAALMLSAAAHAQDAPASPPAAAAAAAAAAPARKSYSPDQMSSFARATVELQNLGSQDPEQMTRAIQGAGMSVEDYNQMGDAMRSDPKLASSLSPYLDSANTERAARIYAQRSQTPSFAGTPRRTRSHATASHKATTSHKSHKASRSGAYKASHTRSTKHAHVTKASHKASSHKASTSHTAKKAPSHKSSSTAAHKSKRHKHS